MQIAKLKVLIEAGAVRAAAASYQAELSGWTVQITYASRAGFSWPALVAVWPIVFPRRREPLHGYDVLNGRCARRNRDRSVRGGRRTPRRPTGDEGDA